MLTKPVFLDTSEPDDGAVADSSLSFSFTDQDESI